MALRFLFPALIIMIQAWNKPSMRMHDSKPTAHAHIFHIQSLSVLSQACLAET